MAAKLDGMTASPHITFRAPRELWDEAKAIAASRKENLSLHVLRPALETYVSGSSERVALLIESRDGNTFAVICNSREDADELRALTPHEVVGVAPIVSAADAML